ncbi:substance-P receptor-like [Saccostrea cucullata]|uniref:substance-P receptor-like n=1 Tax=Saccostrea cuccullata TaxID=36930 RepID=UPI002ED42B43
MNLSHLDFAALRRLLSNSSINLKNDDSDTSNLERTFQIYLYAFTMFLSFFANFSLIAVVLSAKSLRTKFNFFVVNFSFVNLLIPTFCMWLHLIFHLDKGQWRFGPFFCKINIFLQVLVVCVSNFTLTVTVLDRFLATFSSPLQKYTQDHVIIVMLVVWISGLVLSLPYIFYTKFSEFNWIGGHERLCQAHFPSMEARRAYVTIFSLLGYVLPVLVMFFLMSISLRSTDIPNDSMEREVRIRCQMKRRALHYVFTVLIVFFLCWSPQQFLMLWDVFRERTLHTKLPKGIHQYSFYSYYVAYASSCVYPILYMTFNKGFRYAITQILRRKRHTTKGNTMVTDLGGQNDGFENDIDSFETLEKDSGVEQVQLQPTNQVQVIATIEEQTQAST